MLSEFTGPLQSDLSAYWFNVCRVRGEVLRGIAEIAQLSMVDPNTIRFILGKVGMTNIYAHSVEGRDRTEWEILEDHSRAVSVRAAGFATSFNGEDVAALLGWVHDLGKAKQRFQAKLSGDPNTEPHSGEGAQVLYDKYGAIGALLATCVAGHHSGLPD